MRLETPACAAIKLATGAIIAGHRHHDCLAGIAAMVSSLAPSDSMLLAVVRKNSTQGFMTTKGRFVDRTEARNLFNAAGMVSASPDGYWPTDELYSEDLY